MSRRRIAWEDGEERVQRWVEGWVRDEDETSTESELLHQTPRRVLYRLATMRELSIDSSGTPAIRAIVVKIHRTHSGQHPTRETIKKRAGYSPALREWRALVELHAAHVPVPEPLAWGILPGGDPVVVTEYFDGEGLTSRLASAPLREREAWIDRVAEAVSRFHAAGYRHGDLHLGNLHTRGEDVMILDVQRAHPMRHPREVLRDLAHLDFSLARAGFGSDLRRRLRIRLAAPAEFDRASRRFVRDFLRGRSRRELRSGRAWSPWQPDGFENLAGLFDARASCPDLESALGEAITDPRPGDRRNGRTRISEHSDSPSKLIVKRTTETSRRRIAFDRVRGSSAMRSFRIGQHLALLGPLAARPLAALEERESRRPNTSWLILEKVGLYDLDRYRPESEAAAMSCLQSLADWIAEWQAWGIDHLDLKASNIRVDDREEPIRFWLVDLADIRFRRRPSDRSRLRALVQLNASLSDDSFSSAARKAGLDRYLERLPFERAQTRDLIETIVRRSLARKHRWQGLDCTTPRDAGSSERSATSR